MPDQATLDFIAGRIAQSKVLAREHRQEENPELFETAKDIFAPMPIECIDIEVTNPHVKGYARPFFFLNEETLLRAEEENKNLRFTWLDGASMFTTSEWRTGAIPHTQPFKFANKPMRCLGNYLERE